MFANLPAGKGNDMRIAVTGATSMIGAALIKECIKNGGEVLAIVRNGTGRIKRLPVSGRVKVEYADLNHLDVVRGDEESYDVFYHFAWEHTAKAERDNPLEQERNIRSTLSAVELADKLGCRKFIGAGSQAEYGRVDGLIDADTRPHPVTAYGIAKLSANMLSRRMCEQLGMAHIWGRIFSVYGPNDNEGTMLDYAVRQFLKGEKALFSPAVQMWDYLYEDDAGRLFYLLGEKEVEGGTYVVANGSSQILRQYIEEMAAVFGGSAACEFAPLDPQSPALGLNADISKTINAVGYTPQVSFAEGIRKMIDSLKTRGGVIPAPNWKADNRLENRPFLFCCRKAADASVKRCAA